MLIFTLKCTKYNFFLSLWLISYNEKEKKVCRSKITGKAIKKFRWTANAQALQSRYRNEIFFFSVRRRCELSSCLKELRNISHLPIYLHSRHDVMHSYCLLAFENEGVHELFQSPIYFTPVDKLLTKTGRPNYFCDAVRLFACMLFVFFHRYRWNIFWLKWVMEQLFP